MNVEDPDAPSQLMDPEILEYSPYLVTKLAEEGFRAVQVASGDSISIALSDKGDLRAWGCFRVCLLTISNEEILINNNRQLTGFSAFDLPRS